jgi:transcriptional regulator GlxA family with amidase domain
MKRTASLQPITTGFLLIENFALFSYAMTIEPLRAANTLSGQQLYKWVHISAGGGAVRASNGVLVSSDYKVGGPIAVDRLYVCAGGNPASFKHAATLRWLKQLSREGLSICGISGGPYLLARAGLLDGYRFTIHWEHVPTLGEEFPHLEPDRGLYVIDRDRLTCAGGLAALDMMHEVIEGDYGALLASAVGRWFLQSEIRPPDRPQRSNIVGRLTRISPRLRQVLTAIEANLDEPVSRADLAGRAGLSLRQLDRVFHSELRTTLGAYYLAARLERARILLLQTSMSAMDVAVACGFQSASHFSRAYKRYFGSAPSLERKSQAQAIAETRDDAGRRKARQVYASS